MLRIAAILMSVAVAVVTWRLGDSGAHAQASAQPAHALADDVRARERAFARTMGDRDHAAFISFLADEAVFVGANATFRGKSAVADGWKRFFEGRDAPFSWEPDRVEVLESGTLALSSGPVFDPQGKRMGTFNSVWRREPDGTWKIVLDHGCPPCDCR